MKALREKNRVSKVALEKEWSNYSQLEKALETLIADGLIETTGKSFRLAS
ncbi:unannotated protein [freshwater metagenome]|nr:hypothetical protein [Actinomycetota bacterium]